VEEFIWVRQAELVWADNDGFSAGGAIFRK